MSGWVHADDEAAWKADDSPGDCGCRSVTPDPASPCRRCGRDLWNIAHPLIPGEPRRDHPHQPTRCACGHPIEERA